MLNVGFILLAFLLSLASMPIIIKICQKHNLYDYHDQRKIHSGDIPRLGGIGIFIAFFVCAIAFLLVNKNVSTTKSLPILISALIVFLFAMLDDVFTFPALVKLLVQLAATAIVTFNGYRFTQIFGWQLPTVIGHILTFGWVLGLINAYNLIDGLDGLCGTLSSTAVITLGVIYTLSGNAEGYLCFILAAAILGFICFNWPPAKIFMGDCGSQFLGFMIAIIPLYSSSDIFEYNKFLIMIVLTAFPVFDTIAAIWRRLRDHVPIMSPDKAHLHHKLLNMGYSGKQALYLVATLQIILCGSCVLSYFMGKGKGTAELALSVAFMIWIFAVLHYTNRRINRDRKLKELEAKKNADQAETVSKPVKNN